MWVWWSTSSRREWGSLAAFLGGAGHGAEMLRADAGELVAVGDPGYYGDLGLGLRGEAEWGLFPNGK
jgi:hypothetical protein